MKVKWLGALLASVVLVAAPATTQEEGDDTAVETPVASSIVPVSLIPERTEALQQDLRRISESVAAAEPAVSQIERDLPGLNETSVLRLEQTEALLAASPSLEELRDAETDWIGRLRSLSSRREMLAKRATALEDEVVRLQDVDRVWRLSLENARENRAPREVLNTVQVNLSAIEALTDRVRERWNVVLTLLTAVSERELEASDASGRISSARVAIRSRLFEPDAETLWSAFSAGSAAPFWGPVRRAASSDWKEFLEFVGSRKRSFVPLAIVFVGSLVLAFYVGDRMRKRVEDGRLEGSAASFERPVSVAMLVTAFCGAAVFPFAPGLVWDFVGIVLLLPVWRLLVPVVPGTARPLLGILACFYLVDRVRDFIGPALLVERTLFFGEMTAAILAIVLLLQPSRLSRVSAADTPPPVIGLGLRIVVGAFAIAAVANLLGYVAFAQLMGDGALGSIYLSLLSYAGYRIGTTFALVLLTSIRLGAVGVIRNNTEQLVQWCRRGLAVLFAVLWVTGSLNAFAIRDVVFGAVETLLFTPFNLGTLSLSIGSVIAFPLTIFIAFTLSRAIRSLLREDIFPRVTLGRGVGNALSTSVHYVLLLGGFFIALGAAGIDLSKFALLAGAFGVGIGFGLQNVVNNFVSGLILLYERPVQVGDTIELSGLLGEVRSIGIRASTVLTFQGAEVIIPNGNLLADQLINWTLSNKHRRVEVPVGVAYGNKPSDVIPVLKSVLDGEKRILRNPEPLVLFRGFGDSSLDFELRFWARDYTTYLVLASDIASKVYDELERVGITIPFPQRDLHLKSVDSSAAKQLRGGNEERHDPATPENAK